MCEIAVLKSAAPRLALVLNQRAACFVEVSANSGPDGGDEGGSASCLFAMSAELRSQTKFRRDRFGQDSVLAETVAGPGECCFALPGDLDDLIIRFPKSAGHAFQNASHEILRSEIAWRHSDEGSGLLRIGSRSGKRRDKLKSAGS